MNDADENTSTENILLKVADALDAAGVPRTDIERDGHGVNVELGLPSRVRWLVDGRDDMKRKFADISAAFDECAKERDDHAVHLSELHTKLQHMLDAESVANAIAAALKAQRNAFIAAADDTANLATENLLQERTIAKLIVKIKRLQERSTPKLDKSPKSRAKPKPRKR